MMRYKYEFKNWDACRYHIEHEPGQVIKDLIAGLNKKQKEYGNEPISSINLDICYGEKTSHCRITRLERRIGIKERREEG